MSAATWGCLTFALVWIAAQCWVLAYATRLGEITLVQLWEES